VNSSSLTIHSSTNAGHQRLLVHANCVQLGDHTQYMPSRMMPRMQPLWTARCQSNSMPA
jgi:hypothetical protein